MYNNVLIFSDLHINDYANYNRYKEYRLFQSRTLANLIVKAGKDYNCDRFIIAGDVVEVPVIKSTVLNEVKSFLKYICSYYSKDNYIIYGQHDLSTKDINQDPRFSSLTAILPDNLYYSDMRQFNLCGRSVAMMNWKPNQDLSWINGTVDLFVGHVTLSPPNAQFKGQDIDNSKFNLSITGDIHKHFVKGNMVSIGSCQQNKLGDQMESTAIVWNPNDNSWKCIDLDPDKKLLRLRYTFDKNKEGFDPDENFYNVYRPKKIINQSSDVINIPKWSEISDLTEKIIRENGLSEIHNEVLKNCRFEDDVDFNFQILRLRLKDFRSIESAEIYFDDMDKVSISGENGSGKSSIILGLYNALRENRSIKDLIRFGANSCECEVEFKYQGSVHTILRGSKAWGCWINGEKLPYNNKREFEDDMLRRYSFLNYVDIYFFNADRSTVIGSLSPERKSEVISKIFRINKIDSYNFTSSLMRDELIELTREKVNRAGNLNAVIKSISDQMSSIQLPSSSREDLVRTYNSLISQQREYEEFLEFKSSSERLKGMIDSDNNQIINLESQLKLIDLVNLTEEKINLEVEVKGLHESKVKWSNLMNRKANLESSLDRVNQDGTRVYEDLVKVKSNTCPTCGSHIVLKDLEDKLTSDINYLVSSRDGILNELYSVNDEISRMNFNENEVNLKIDKLNRRIEEVSFEISRFNSMSMQVTELNEKLSSHKMEMKSKIGDKVFSVTSLPSDIQSKISEASIGIGLWDRYNDLVSRMNSSKLELDSINKELDEVNNGIQILDKYIKLTSSTGDIYKEVMSRISKDFSDDIIRYEVNQYKFRNKDHLDLDIQYNVAGRWVSYQSLSSGQKTMADISFLSKILVECGLLVFDETLKHLSPSSTEYCIDIMKRMNVHLMILTSHMYGTEMFSNKIMNLELDGSGLTKVDIL